MEISGPNSRDSEHREIRPPERRSGTGRELIVNAAISVFFDHGYHGTTLREIAGRAGVAPSAPYHYFSSKQDLFVDIIESFMSQSVSTIRQAVADAGVAPAQQLMAAAYAHVYRNATNVSLSFITNSEIRSLEPDNRSRHVKHRDQIQSEFDRILEDGKRQNEFDVKYPKDASRAIVTMCTAVASWYSPNGPLAPEEVALRYGEFALKLVGAPARPHKRS